MTSAIGLYHPGTSVLHRLPAAVKLFGLLVGAALVVVFTRPWQVAVGALAVSGLFTVGRIPARLVLAQLRPLRWFLLVLAVLQVLLAGPAAAVAVCGSLLVSVALASVVTLTTRVTDMLDVVQRIVRPLRRFGVDPDRVGLVLVLTIRLVPVMVGIVGTASEARKARGAGFSLRALAVPVVVRTLRTADAIGEALLARGVDD